MKVRNGFVSNSSSSSFVVFGVKGDTEYDYNETYSKDIKSYYTNQKDYAYITGFLIADEDYHSFPETIIPFDELQTMAQIVSSNLKVDIKEVKLIIGTRWT